MWARPRWKGSFPLGFWKIDIDEYVGAVFAVDMATNVIAKAEPTSGYLKSIQRSQESHGGIVIRVSPQQKLSQSISSTKSTR